MQVLRAERHVRMPWKNGGGETTEIIVSPAGAGLEDFDWRVSMARVAASGPFSRFDGIDRTLTLLDGDGLTLRVAGRPPVTLTTISPPVAFPADVPTTAALTGGPVVDLNVMTRRGGFSHTVTPFGLDGARDLDIASATTLLLLCRSGAVTVRTAGGTATLGPLDALHVDDAPPDCWSLTADAPAHLVLIAILRGREGRDSTRLRWNFDRHSLDM